MLYKMITINKEVSLKVPEQPRQFNLWIDGNSPPLQTVVA